MWFRKAAQTNFVEPSVLDRLHINVMVADNDLTIRYMNPAAAALMADAEADLQRELPRFSMATLIGSNIDIFHKTPDRQRSMLKALETTHSATIEVGKWVFDLTVTPIIEGGERRGFVVEWANAADRIARLKKEEELRAVGRSNALIEFDTEGRILFANENFLSAFGYKLDEIAGKHHRIFVDATYAASHDYVDFWNRLRAGQVFRGQYRRFAKDGSEIWIEGAYSPIFDRHGKVQSVMKAATDVTKQIQIVNSLKTMVQGVNQSVQRTQTETASVVQTSGDLSVSVQSVAEHAGQLAGSISEIAQSMAASRQATEDAVARTGVVGDSTASLAKAAEEMSGIVSLIRTIASQINLLSLNATIEAARAGEAGKGFAVVASEVKSLALQAAKATEQISTEIDGIQGISRKVALAVDDIKQAVRTLRENATATSAAVEEQSAVTRGMSDTMNAAAGKVAQLTDNVGSIASAIEDTAAQVSEGTALALKAA